MKNKILKKIVGLFGYKIISKYNLEYYDFSKIKIEGKIRKYND